MKLGKSKRRSGLFTKRLFTSVLVLLMSLDNLAGVAAVAKPNVLYVLFDDLRPTVGSYDDDVAKTPYLDAFFAQSVQFDNMHSSKAECAPSRASMMAGQRPDRIRIWDFKPKFRKNNPKLVTLPGHFRKAGYRTVMVGKVYDNRSFYKTSKKGTKTVKPAPDLCNTKRPKKECSWDSGIVKQAIQVNQNDMCQNNGTEYFPGSGASDPYDQHLHLAYSYDDAFQSKDQDYCVTSVAIQQLETLAAAGEPFFLAVGIVKPHLPWVRPQSIADHFAALPDSDFEVPSYNSTYWKDTHVRWSKSNSAELSSYDDYASYSDVDRVRGYYGATTFADEQFGRLLGALDAMPIANNTFVIVWGDHGFHLGDRDLWGKKTIFDQATRVPFGIRPAETWLADNQDVANNGIGARVLAPTDSVDILPTLLDLCNIDLPSLSDRAGASMVPLMRNPAGSIRAAAISQYEAYSVRNYMGYSIRSSNYRLVLYAKERKLNSKNRKVLPYKKSVDSSRLALYYYDEPGQIELVNHVNDPTHAAAYAELLQLFKQNKDRDWTHLIGVKPFDL